MKKVLISVLLLIAVAMIFGTATYAWISLSTINNIEGINLSASTAEELQLSHDGIEFSNQLSLDTLIEDPDGFQLYDITSKDGINFETGGLREHGIAIANEHYISFDVWFRTSTHERSLYIINNISNQITYDDLSRPGTYVVSKGVIWRAPHQFFNGPDLEDVVNQGDMNTYYGSEAIRISFVELVDDQNDLDTRNQDDLKVLIFDPSGNPERGYGALFGQFSYFFNRTLIYVDLPKEIPSVSYRLSEMDPENPYQALDNESEIASLQPTGIIDPNNNREYFQAKVRINIWIEGWDADAFDALDKDRIKIQLQFKLAKRA